MARITIIPDDNIVIVDGDAREISMVGIDPAIHAVQWFGAAGEIEYNDGRAHEPITDITPFQIFITRWNDAEPAPPTLADRKVHKGKDFKAEAVIRIAAQVPDWDSIEAIKTVAGMWVSHLAGNATVAQLKAKDIYLYIRNTVPPKIMAITTEANLAAVDPTSDDPFGDGTNWPV